MVAVFSSAVNKSMLFQSCVSSTIHPKLTAFFPFFYLCLFLIIEDIITIPVTIN